MSTVAGQVLIPPGIDGDSVRMRVLRAEGDSAVDISAGAVVIEPDGGFDAPYTPADGPGAVMLCFQYRAAGEAALRVWLTALEPGRFQYPLPTGPGAMAAGSARLTLTPSLHGFRFVNGFEGSPVPDSIGRAIGAKFDGFGLCGGMSFAAADLFYAGRPRPEAQAPPPAGSPLFKYLYRRQTDSLGPLAVEGLRFGQWMALPTGTIAGTGQRTFGEVAAARALLDAGSPAVLGLVYVGEGDGKAVWQNHQVLAYAYSAAGDGTVWISVYDPNYPGRDDVTIRAVERAAGSVTLGEAGRFEVSGVECHQYRGSQALRPVRGFFVMPYAPADPPAGVAGDPWKGN
jgi:hypothetical protein